MDTGADMNVRVGYGDNYVVIEDTYEEGMEDLSHFYNLFAGSKRDSHTKRGRFGRGAKELLAASDRTVVHTTGGTGVFEVYQDAGGRWQIDGEVHEDVTAKEGTYVFAKNADWTDEDLSEVNDYVGEIIVPDDRDFTIEHVDHEGSRPERVSAPKESQDPDYVIDGTWLPTIVYEDGEHKNPKKKTDVEVYRTEPGEGGIYEMGIPITTEEDFPIRFNIQQRTPVAEQRNKIGDEYRTKLMRRIINENLNFFSDKELGEEFVTGYLSKYSSNIDTDVQEEYLERVFGSIDERLVYDDSTPAPAVHSAKQHQQPLAPAHKESGNVADLLNKHLRSVESWYENLKDGTTIEVVEDPTEEQQEFMEYAENEILGRNSAYGADFEMAMITDESDAETLAMHDPDQDTIYFNTLADEWDRPTAKRVGTILHELGHHESFDPGHGTNWYHKVEELSGEVVMSLEDDVERLERKNNELREEKWELKHKLDAKYEGPLSESLESARKTVNNIGGWVYDKVR
jgi:hypothetical protein